MKIILYYICGLISAFELIAMFYNSLLILRNLAVGIDIIEPCILAIVSFALSLICGIVADKIEENF
jgi:hypothetical protein